MEFNEGTLAAICMRTEMVMHSRSGRIHDHTYCTICQTAEGVSQSFHP